MLRTRDPLADPKPLIDAVYAFVAYRIGHGVEAEDVTAEAFARAARYRDSYEPARGEPTAWVIGIARRCIEDARATPRHLPLESVDAAGSGELDVEAVARLELNDAIAALAPRERELIALRFGADLSTRQIAAVLGLSHGAARVALHRALERLRSGLDIDQHAPSAPARAGLVPSEEAM